MEPQVEVRSATRADVRTLVALVEQYWKFEAIEGFDATRIAAQVVTGIGFLGAGCIIQQGAHITGLTTAATIWVVAAIGLIAGAGFPLLALIAALLVLGTLVVLAPIEERLFHPSHGDDFHDGEKR